MSSDEVNGPSTSELPSTCKVEACEETQEAEKPSGPPKKPVPPWLKKYIARQRKLKEEEEAQHSLLCEKHRERSERQKQHTLTLEQTKEQITTLEQRLKHLRNEKHELFASLKKVLNKEKRADPDQSPLAEARARVAPFPQAQPSSSEAGLSTTTSLAVKRPHSPPPPLHPHSILGGPTQTSTLLQRHNASGYPVVPPGVCVTSAAAYFTSIPSLDASLTRQPPDSLKGFHHHTRIPSVYSPLVGTLNHHDPQSAVDRHFLTAAYATNAKMLNAASHLSRYGTIANPPEAKKASLALEQAGRPLPIPLATFPNPHHQLNTSRDPSSTQRSSITSPYAPLDKRRPYLHPPRTPYDSFF